MPIGPREKLIRARKLAGWTQYQCDDFVGVKRGRTYSYERGRAAPPLTFLEPLAEAWGIPVTWFLDPVDDLPPQGSAPSANPEAPLRGDVPGPLGAPEEGRVPVRTTFPVPADAYWLRVRDGRYAPTLLAGDLLLVAPSPEVYVGAISIAEADGQRSVVISTDAQTEVCGHVVEVRRRAGPAIVAWECRSGLAADMIRTS